MPDAGVLAWASVDVDVDARHLELFGRGFRRIGRYVKLAQVGAVACRARVPELVFDPRRTGVYFGSGIGNAVEIVPLAEGILHPERPWTSPMAFAGCVGNSAAFYVARTLGLEGPNETVSQEELSFEGALLQAILALADGSVDHAFVGGVDVRSGNDEEQRARINARAVEGELGDASAWVLLGRGGSIRVGVSLGAAAPVPPHASLGWRFPEGDRRLIPVASALRLVEALDRGGEHLLVQRSGGGSEGRIRVGHSAGGG